MLLYSQKQMCVKTVLKVNNIMACNTNFWLNSNIPVTDPIVNSRET